MYCPLMASTSKLMFWMSIWVLQGKAGVDGQVVEVMLKICIGGQGPHPPPANWAPPPIQAGMHIHTTHTRPSQPKNTAADGNYTHLRRDSSVWRMLGSRSFSHSRSSSSPISRSPSSCTMLCAAGRAEEQEGGWAGAAERQPQAAAPQGATACPHTACPGTLPCPLTATHPEAHDGLCILPRLHLVLRAQLGEV